MIKVLIVGIHDAIGGVERIAYDYVRHIISGNTNGDINFSFTNMYEKIVCQDEYEAMGCRIFPVPNVKKNPAAYARALLRIIKNENINAVHCHMLSAANIVPLVAAKFAKCDMIIAHSHNAGTVGLHKYVMHHINRMLIPLFATDYFTCSENAGRFMFGGKGKKAVLIRNAIDAENFSFDPNARKKIRAELHIADGAPVIGHVGRFAEAKNHRFLIEIFRCVSQINENAKLLLVGEGHLEPDIRALVKRYDLDGKVIFYGTSTKIHELYSAMDVFVLPSLFEGFSMVGTEAQANGLTVIVSEVMPLRMDVTGNVLRLRLSDAACVWANAALEGASKRGGCEVTEAIINAGYDIAVESAKLADIYLRRL